MVEFKYVGISNPPDIWNGRNAKRYRFDSVKWLLFTSMRVVPESEIVFEGEIENCDSEAIYHFTLSNEGILIVYSPFNRYVEGINKLPIPKYVSTKIKEIYRLIQSK